MASESYDISRLEAIHKKHAAKILDLSRELEHVKNENEALRDLVHGKRGPDFCDPSWTGDKYKKAEEGSIHDDDFGLGPDGKPKRYWGFNKFYTPEMATSKRWEDLQNVYSKIEDWKRRRQLEEEKWMKDKPRTYEYTVPYQDISPPRDLNKYFQDSKYDKKAEPQPDDYYSSQQPTGGLYIMRYDDSGHEEVNLALRNMQTIIKSYDGYVMGLARKHCIFVLEGDCGWKFSKKEEIHPRIGFRHRLAENGIAVLWFSGQDKAHGFFCNSFRNPFKEQGFPTPGGFECFFVPMNTQPVFRTHDTYLLIEFTNANKCPPEDMLGFEAEAREEMQKIVPSCYPMVVSCLQHKENSFKPGSFLKPNSKLFVSRFNSQTDVAAVWNSGILQGLRNKYNLNALRMNVESFSLKDWQD